MTGTVYDFTATAIDGTEVPLDRFRGQALLIVNTASKCGFTGQYAGLEALHRRYADQPFEVLGFPCNQFGAQEPGRRPRSRPSAPRPMTSASRCSTRSRSTGRTVTRSTTG